MNILFPVIELIDRYAIACVKAEMTQTANKEELDFYSAQLDKFDIKPIQDKLTRLEIIHKKIWELESLIRQGKEQELGLEEIGWRALAIRDWNNKRNTLKNQIAEQLNCSVREVKRDHLSE